MTSPGIVHSCLFILPLSISESAAVIFHLAPRHFIPVTACSVDREPAATLLTLSPKFSIRKAHRLAAMAKLN